MFAPRVKQWIGTGVVLTAMAISGCARSDRLPTSSQEPKSLFGVAQARAALRRPVSAEEYTQGNPMGWTGRAHNRFLAEALLKTVNISSPRERCVALARVLREGRWLGEDRVRFSEEERSRYSVQALSAYPGCGNSARQDADRNVAYRKAMTAVSDITPFTDAIMAAVGQASSSNGLATTLAVITDSAAQVLTGDDLNNVYAAASFTVSSARYWEANGDWQVDAMASGGMGDCIAATGTVDGCVYASRGPRRQQGPTFRLAAARMPLATAGMCPYKWNGWAVTAGDLGGFMGGLLTVGVGGGVFVGAVASVSAFASEAGREVYCRLTHQQ
jgi:hypothetical protein